MLALALSAFGLLSVVGAWMHYLSLISSERVPRRPTAWSITMAAGIGVGSAGVLLEPSALHIGLLAGSGGFGFFFFGLLSQRHTPAGALTVSVGDRIPEFTAVDANGASVGPASWSGRTLFKLFRGHW